MVEAVKSVLSQYFVFNGRARRSEFWFWVLATILVRILVAALEFILGLSYDGSGVLSGILNLLIFFPGLAVTFRRLHDIGRSGWWIGCFYLSIIFYFILIIFAVSGATVSNSNTNLLAGIGIFSLIFVIGILVYAIVLLVFFCQDSEAGPNKYGPNPKNLGNYDIFE